MSNQKLLLTSYRALLRWSARCGEAPVRFQTEHLREVCPAISEGKDLLLDSAGLRSMVQWQFRKRENKAYGAGENVTQAFAALKLLNTHYEPLLHELVEERISHMDRQGISFRIGEVVQHSQRGYTAVVTGWDRVCENISLLEDPDVNLVQPFYRVVTDADPFNKSHGSSPRFRYLPQDELRSVKNEAFVQTKRLDEFFDGYSAQLGRYIPKKHIRWEYPDEYTTDDIQPCGKLLKKTHSKGSPGMAGIGKSVAKTKQRRKERTAEGSSKVKSNELRDHSQGSGSSAIKSITSKQRSVTKRKEAATLEGQDKHG